MQLDVELECDDPNITATRIKFVERATRLYEQERSRGLNAPDAWVNSFDMGWVGLRADGKHKPGFPAAFGGHRAGPFQAFRGLTKPSPTKPRPSKAGGGGSAARIAITTTVPAPICVEGTDLSKRKLPLKS